METRDLIGPGIELPIGGVSSLVESLIAMRFVERRSRAHRLLAVLKVRGSDFDPALREFVITNGQGISVAGTFDGAEELLSGFARDRAAGRQSSGPEDP
jgi:circadian clock protein KaiC